MTTTPPSPVFDADFRAELEALFAWRRDVRHFRETPLPAGTVEDLLRIAHCAPSVGNSQPWRFVRVKSAALRTALADHADAEVARDGAQYREGKQRSLYDSLKLHGLREAPEVIAVFNDDRPKAGHGLGAASMPEARRYSTVMAIHTMWLAARAQGLGLGWVSVVDPAWISAQFDAPPQWTFMALLCLGYPVKLSATPELEERGWQTRQDWKANVSER